MKFHPFKSIEDQIGQIVAAIPGLGSASAGVYTRAYFVYTVYNSFPETACGILLPLFTSYGRSLLHLKGGAFDRQFKIMDYTFGKYIDTHGPALRFFLSVMVQVGDTQFLRNALDEFYSLGVPSAFILDSLLEELPPKFVARIYPVLLMLIDKSDDVVPHPRLIHRLLTSLTNATLAEGILELMNEIWNRMREFRSVEDFVYVAAPMTSFIAKFCSPHYLNLFLSNVAQVLHHNFAARKDEATGQRQGARLELSKKLTECVSECIVAVVSRGKSFEEVLTHSGAIVELMDFLSEKALSDVSRLILNDISVKQFELNDPLCIRILLELSQILFQSLSILSPVDVVKSVNRAIEWFLYRVDFGANVEAHLSFLLSARQAFPTGSRLLAAIALIALRLTSQVAWRKPTNWDVIVRSLLAFAFVTIPSVPEPLERAKLYLTGANCALVSTVVCFAHACFDEFAANLAQAPASPAAYQLYTQGLQFLLVMPAKPAPLDEPDNAVPNAFASFTGLITSGIAKDWGDDERIRFALDAMIILSHALRSEYVLRVHDVDSNDVLFAGNAEFQDGGRKILEDLATKFAQLCEQYRKRGPSAQARIQPLALKAIGTLVDVVSPNEPLIRLLKILANMTGTVDKELKKRVVRHLQRAIGASDSGAGFLRIYAQGLE
jgi:hypothetical protein